MSVEPVEKIHGSIEITINYNKSALEYRIIDFKQRDDKRRLSEFSECWLKEWIFCAFNRASFVRIKGEIFFFFFFMDRYNERISFVYRRYEARVKEGRFDDWVWRRSKFQRRSLILYKLDTLKWKCLIEMRVIINSVQHYCSKLLICD